VAHWNGHTWTRTSVKRLLPARRQLNNPAVTSMFAQSASSVWAVGDGNLQDEGGPLVVLHYNGHRWSKVAGANIGGYQIYPSVTPDGRGGLWIPVSPSAGGSMSRFVHYSGGHLSIEPLPVPANKIEVLAVSAIPHTSQALAVGFTHSAKTLGAGTVGVILQSRG
jgi:hypothetical protein